MLYQRLFAEIFLYLKQNETTTDWCAVVIYPKRSMEPDESRLYRALLESPQVQRMYLDELAEVTQQSLGVGLVQLVVESANAAQRARQLIEQATQETVLSSISNMKL